MLHCGAISGNIDRTKASAASAGGTTGSTPPVHDLNVPYEATSEEYATPTADMLFPPVRLNPLIALKNCLIYAIGKLGCEVLKGLVVFVCRRRCRRRSRLLFQGRTQGCTTYQPALLITPHHQSVMSGMGCQ